MVEALEVEEADELDDACVLDATELDEVPPPPIPPLSLQPAARAQANTDPTKAKTMPLRRIRAS